MASFIRTYDKLIATIPARQRAGDLRSCFGQTLVGLEQSHPLKQVNDTGRS